MPDYRNPQRRVRAPDGSTAIAAAPRSAISIYHQAREEAIDAGANSDESHRRGLRHLFHAGWFRKGSKWEQIHPDLRGKVTLRTAHKQPDGRFLIEGVPVFYSNAVKGGNEKYTPDDIASITKNTNAMVLAGGQKPALLEGHAPTSPEGRMMAQLAGIQSEPHGFAVNWREHPQRKGWAQCDLVDVEPQYVQKLRDRKLTGLSAYISRDASKLNRRFGHVALLGGTTQALSRLPTLEVFSADACCFAADDGLIAKPLLKGSKMLSLKNPNHRKLQQAMNEAYEAHESAMASQQAGEPGAEEKLDEADGRYSAACKEFADAMGGEAPAAEPGAMPGGEAQPEPTDGQAPAFEDDPAGAFDALQSKVGTLTQNLTRANALNARMKSVMETLGVKAATQEFESFFDDLTRKGHQLPEKKGIMTKHSTLLRAGNKDALVLMKEMLGQSPRKAQLSEEPEHFADGTPADSASFSAVTDADIDRVVSITGIDDFASRRSF